jgi:hypothetical protein
MSEILTVMAELLRRDSRFDDLAREVARYLEIVFKKDRCINTLHHDRSEGGYEHSTMRKWRNTIERRLEVQQL